MAINFSLKAFKLEVNKKNYEPSRLWDSHFDNYETSIWESWKKQPFGHSPKRNNTIYYNEEGGAS